MEILIRIVDKAGEDCFKRNDILETHPDGWPWSERERTNPAWRIVRAPLYDSEVSGLLASKHGRRGLAIPLAPPRRRREYQVAVAQLPGVDAPRDGIIEPTRAQFMAAVAQK